MKLAGNLLLKALGILLLTAAVLKGWQLLTEPVANSDIWSNRYFMIFQVEFELALGIWLVSGLFAKAAWLVSLLCFLFFSVITFYKAIAGYASCGCFGSVHVNPYITLFLIDLPSVVALSFLRPRCLLPGAQAERSAAESKDLLTSLLDFLKPLPSMPRFAVTACLGLTILGVTTPILAINEPAKVTTRYEVLEPET